MPSKVTPPKTDRNKKIVLMLDTGQFTLAQIGELYGVSRERIRQIYHRQKKHGFKKRLDKTRVIREKQERKKANSIKFECHACGKPVKFKDGKHSRGICKKCTAKFRKQGRDPWTTFNCLICGKPYHPFRNARHYAKIGHSNAQFCSAKCYMTVIQDHVNTPEKKARAKAHRDAVISLRKKGYTYPMIKKETGLAETTIYFILKKAGIIDTKSPCKSQRPFV